MILCRLVYRARAQLRHSTLLPAGEPRIARGWLRSA